MTKLETSKAKEFLEGWAETTPDDTTDEEIFGMIAHLSELVDREFKRCSPEQEAKLEEAMRKKEGEIEDGKYDAKSEKEHKAKIDQMRKQRLGLWMLMASGLKTVIAMKNVRAFTVDALILSLGELARGHPKVTAFDVNAKSNIPSEDELWLKAKVIAATIKYPERRKTIVARAASLMSIETKQVEKMIYNFDSGPLPSLALTHLVEVAKTWDEKDKEVVDLLGELTS